MRAVRSPLLDRRPKTVGELLAAAEEHWVGDLCQLSWLFHDRQRETLSTPTILNPTFDGSPDIGGADADLVLGSQLIEIKTTVKQRIDRLWLYQLAGYLLLDYNNRYELDGAGFYLGRQGTMLQWPLSEFLSEIAGDATIPLEQLRPKFRDLLQATRPSTSTQARRKR